MDQVPTTYLHEARNQAQSVLIGDGIAPHPNVGCVFYEDLDNGKRRGLLQDYANFQKLSQASDICKLTGATPIAPDDIDASEKALYMLYEQQNAKAVAGMTLAQLINPGCQAVYCPASTMADMRTALCVYSPPERISSIHPPHRTSAPKISLNWPTTT